MKSKTMKAIFAFILVAMICSVFSGVVMAVDPDQIKPIETPTTASVTNIAGMILSIVQVVATAAAVIMLIVLAIKYISAAPEGKAEIKKTAIIYVVGAILLFAASGILGIIRSFANEINEPSGGTTSSIVTKVA